MQLANATVFITGANRGLGLAFARAALAAGARKVYAAARDPDSIEATRRMMETNVYGLLRVGQAFAPVLARNSGGALLNVLSVSSWISAPVLAGYAVSKAAAWSVTNGLRNELRAQGTQVLGMHVGFIDTDLTRGFEAPKLAPDLVAERAYAALEAGASEVAIDEWTQGIKRGLSDAPGIYVDHAR